MTRRLLVVTGVLIMGYAVVGALADPDTRPVGQLLFLAGVLVAHDVALLPIALGVGVLIGRLMPADSRLPVQVAGFVTVTLAVVAIPLVLGFGRRPDEPSALPLPYGRGFAILLLLIWAVAITAILRRRFSSRRTAQASTGRPPRTGDRNRRAAPEESLGSRSMRERHGSGEDLEA